MMDVLANVRTIVLVAGFVGALGPEAGATTITFDSFGGLPSSVTESGFLFTSGDHYHFDLGGIPSTAQNGTAAMLWNHNYSNVMTKVGGGTFDLTSFQGGEYFTDFGSSSTVIRAIGTTLSGTVVQDFSLDGIADGNPTPSDMQDFVLNASFMSLLSVEFQGLSGGPSNTYSLDNIVVNDSLASAPVPEPMSLMLFGSGLIGLARIRALRRQTKNPLPTP
jgi:hypothetical protein